tara:strand:- start:1670 stop:2983 length:1314 start_codon:yes stop_codon:yes gene_type:complete
VSQSSKIYLKFIFRDTNLHPSQDKVIAAFVYDYQSKQSEYFNFEHPDVITNSTFKAFKKTLLNKKVYVNNKKRYKYHIPNMDLYDINLFSFLKDGDVVEMPNHLYTTQLQMTHHKLNQANVIVPYVVHQNEFDAEVDLVDQYEDENTDSYCFKFFNNIVTDTLFEVERNGIHVNTPQFKACFPSARVVTSEDGSQDTVYSEYYLYNPTGRPSNKFDSVNYVALNKEDGCRESFTSRFPNGKLMMVDFTGFHPYLVAQLIQYKVPDEETIYEHLAKQYYNIETVDANTLSKSKKQTMVNLYGQISDKHTKIPYFEKVEELKNRYWEEFTNKGYVKTPIYKRKINQHHIIDPNKNKLFAYIIQATETEYGLNSLGNVLKYVSGKPIIPILYIYDSILFDVDVGVKLEEIKDVIDIIRNKRFKVKVYEGNNYNEMALVSS